MKVLGEVAAGVERKALKGATRGRMEIMVARTPDHHHTPHTTPTPPHNGIKPHHNTHTHPERRHFDHIQQPAAFSELEALLYSLHCQRQRPIAHTRSSFHTSEQLNALNSNHRRLPHHLSPIAPPPPTTPRRPRKHPTHSEYASLTASHHLLLVGVFVGMPLSCHRPVRLLDLILRRTVLQPQRLQVLLRVAEEERTRRHHVQRQRQQQQPTPHLRPL